MIPHYRERGPCLDHPPGYHDRVHLLWPEVYKIAQENDRALRVPPCAVSLFVAHLPQECNEGFCVSVHVPNNVVCLRHVLLMLPSSTPLSGRIFAGSEEHTSELQSL